MTPTAPDEYWPTGNSETCDADSRDSDADADSEVEAASDVAELTSEDAALSLLERLDRRQNQVLQDIDRLNLKIEKLVMECHRDRQRQAAA